MLERGLTAIESHRGFPGFYVLTALAVAFPWAPLVAGEIFGSWPRWIRDRESRFLLAWLIGTVVVLETVQTKLVHYLMPAYPAGILLVVAWLSAGDRDRQRFAALAKGRGLMDGGDHLRGERRAGQDHDRS